MEEDHAVPALSYSSINHVFFCTIHFRFQPTACFSQPGYKQYNHSPVCLNAPLEHLELNVSHKDTSMMLVSSSVAWRQGNIGTYLNLE